MTIEKVLLALLLVGVLIPIVFQSLKMFLNAKSGSSGDPQEGVKLDQEFVTKTHFDSSMSGLMDQIKKMQSEGKCISNRKFNDLVEQVAQLSNNIEKITELSGELLKIAPSLDTLKEIVQDLRAATQAGALNNSDKQFFTENFSRLANQIDTKTTNALVDNSQIDKLSQTLNIQLDKLLQKLKDFLDAQGYKECVNCNYAVVPKSSKYCPDCGQNPDIKTT